MLSSDASSQGRILAVWGLFPRLLFAHLNFAVEFWIDVLLLAYLGNGGPKRVIEEIPSEMHKEVGSGRFPSDLHRNLLVVSGFADHLGPIHVQLLRASGAC